MLCGEMRQSGMRANLTLVGVFFLISTVVSPSPYSDSTAASDATITLTPETTYQVISGWEATAQAGQNDYPALFALYQNSLFDQAVNDLGINALRLETTRAAGPNGPQTGAGFDLAGLDGVIDKVVVPVRQRLAVRGETLYLNI